MVVLSKDICIILLDLWGLSDLQIQQLGAVGNAWTYTRRRIAELVSFANIAGISVYLQNHGWPVPTVPAVLREALLESTVAILPEAFVKEGYKHSRPPGLRTETLIRNTVNFADYPILVYAGYAFDACVAARDGYGYSVAAVRNYNKFIIKDAGLVQYILYHGKSHKLWPEYSRVMKARGPTEAMPWKTAQDIIDETTHFCDNFATRFCTSLFLDEFKEMVSA